MATTVEARARRPGPRGRAARRPGIGTALGCGSRPASPCWSWALLAWFVVASGQRKEEFAAAEPQPGPGGRRGGQSAAGLERAAEAHPDLQGHRRGHRGDDHPEPGPDGERPERARRGRAAGVPGQRIPTRSTWRRPTASWARRWRTRSTSAEAAGGLSRRPRRRPTLEYLKARYLIDAGRAYRAAREERRGGCGVPDGDREVLRSARASPKRRFGWPS